MYISILKRFEEKEILLLIQEKLNWLEIHYQGVFINICTKNEFPGTHYLHHPKFNIDERVLKLGVMI